MSAATRFPPRALGLAALLCLASPSLRAADFGVLSEGQGRWASSSESAFDAAGRLTLWGSFQPSARVRLFASLSASADSAPEAAGSAGFVDLGLCRLDAEIGRAPGAGGSQGASGSILFSAGRFDFGDPTGYVMAHRADGMSLRISTPFALLSAQAAWLGLQPKASSRVFMSAADVADYLDPEVSRAPSRGVGFFSLRLPEILARQDVTFFAAGQADLRAEVEERFDSYYFGLSLRGSLIPGWYWNGFGAGEYSEDGFALLAGASVEYLGTTGLGPTARLDLLAASGENGPLSSFRPISSTILGEASRITATNVAMAALNFGWKLSGTLRPTARAAAYLRTSTGALALEGFDAASSNLYVGTELSAALAFRPLSDLSLGASAGLFLPNAGGSFVAGTPPTTRVRIDAGIAL